MKYLKSELLEYRKHIESSEKKITKVLLQTTMAKKLDLPKTLELARLRGIIEGIDYVLDQIDFLEEL